MGTREGLLQSRLGLRLDLPDSFAADPHALADLLESHHLASSHAEPVHDDGLLLSRQGRQRLLNETVVLSLDELVLGGDDVVVRQILDNRGVTFLADLFVEGELAEAELKDLVDLGDGRVQLGADLFPLGLAPQLPPQLALHVPDFLYLFHLVAGDPHQSMFREGPQDGLPDPPDGVGDELGPLRVVVAVGGLDEPEVPLVQQVFEGEPEVPVLAGHLDDEAEVGLHELVEGPVIPFTDLLGEVDLLVFREKGIFPNLREIARKNCQTFIVRRVHRFSPRSDRESTPSPGLFPEAPPEPPYSLQLDLDLGSEYIRCN